MRILSIETSCDETAVCLLECSGSFGPDFKAHILGNALFSQAALHAPYGGVFPNLAKREHQKNLVPLLTQALEESGQLTVNSEQQRIAATVNCDLPTVHSILARESELLPQLETFLQTYQKPHIDAIAVTFGPGLEPALWPGINFARALSVAWSVPLVPVNHMEGHIIASLVGSDDSEQLTVDSGQKKTLNPSVNCTLLPVTFPAIALLVSGGHTELQLVKGFGDYQLLGQTRDDAAGEAFDKIARVLELPYPGGPEISRLATVSRTSGLMTHDSGLFKLPRPMHDSGDYDFSFSGLKTAARKVIEAHQPLTDEIRMEIARETEDAIVDVLISKTFKAAEEYGAQTIIVGGGVSANNHLKTQLNRKASPYGFTALFPTKEMATDNAIMIGLAGYFRAQRGEFVDQEKVVANGNARV